MSNGCKIFATLLVLTLCLSGTLFAERTRQVGSSNNGDLDLSALAKLGIDLAVSQPINFDPNTMTVNGAQVIRTGEYTARTADGKQIWLTRGVDKTQVHVGNQSMTFYANGSIPVSEPDTYMGFAAQTLSFTDPVTGMPVNVSGTVRLSDFEDVTETPQEISTQSNEFDTRMKAYQEGLALLEASGVDSSTFDIGGLELTLYANGAVLFDPSMPAKLAMMDPDVLDELKGAQLPVAIPMFTVDNGAILFPNGAVRMNLE